MKKLNLLIGFLISIIVLASCSTDSKEIICCTTVDFGLEVIVTNSDGTNILDTVDGIASTDIRLFYKVDDDWVEQYVYDQRNAKGMHVIESQNGEKRLSIALTPDYENKDFTYVKLQFSENDNDIIKGEIDFSNGNLIYKNVWVNDLLKWEAYASERVIILIK